mgnify:CR=1 FL=1
MSMAIKIHGYVPSAGDARTFPGQASAARNRADFVTSVGRGRGRRKRPATLDYMTQVCLAAEYMGADSVLVPIAPGCEDPWVVATTLLARTSTLKFMVAFRPGLMTPVLTAQMIASFQRLSGGRLTLNVTPGIAGPTAHRYGEWKTKAELLEQAGEFLTVVRGVWGEEPFDFKGRWHHVVGGSVTPPDPVPPFYYAGSSEESMEFAARHADVYMSYAEPPDMVAERIDRVRSRAAELGRQIRCALSFQVVARETSEEAWAQVDATLEGIDQTTLERSIAMIGAMGHDQSGARRRLLSRLDGSPTNAVISPNLWIGPMLLRPGYAPVLVGSYTEIADRIQEYAELGCDEFEFGGTPCVEDFLRFGDNVMPILRERGLLDDPTPATTLQA